MRSETGVAITTLKPIDRRWDSPLSMGLQSRKDAINRVHMPLHADPFERIARAIPIAYYADKPSLGDERFPYLRISCGPVFHLIPLRFPPLPSFPAQLRSSPLDHLVKPALHNQTLRQRHLLALRLSIPYASRHLVSLILPSSPNRDSAVIRLLLALTAWNDMERLWSIGRG